LAHTNTHWLLCQLI